jgi:hypothetical protein
VDGNRVKTVTTPTGGPPRVTEYLVDPSGPLSHVVAEGSSTTALSTYYVRGGTDLISAIRPQTSGPATVRHFHSDALGSTRMLTDASGQKTDAWQYDAQGATVSHTGSDPNSYLFAGQPLESNTGWTYNRARWLDQHRDGSPQWIPMPDRSGIRDPSTNTCTATTIR